MREFYVNEDSLKGYIDLLSQPADPKAGAKYDEIAATVPVVRALQRAQEAGEGGHVLRLEEADWKLLCNRLKAAAYVRISQATLDQIDAVLNAKTVEIASVAPIAKRE